MKITYLVLRGFKRFPLSDLEVFEHEFASKLTMITGQNGCGKSSLLNELTPLPSDKNNFLKSGYKEIHIEHNGNRYRLISDFTDGTSYSFIVDEEELNPSNNITTQRDLTYKHFGITPATHELLIGAESFTEMSLLGRKKLFNAITNLNIDKILENYGALKEELKNNELLLKTTTSLLQSEEQKLIIPGRVEELKRTQKLTTEFIDNLLEFRSELKTYKTTDNLDLTYSRYTELSSKLNALIAKYYIRITAYPSKDLDTYITGYTSRLDLVTYQLNGYYKELDETQRELRIAALASESNLVSLQERAVGLTSLIAGLTSSLTYLKDLSRYNEDTKTAVYRLEVSLPEVMRSIPLNPERKFTRERYDALLTTGKETLDKLTHVSTRELSLTKELDRLSVPVDKVECPNCKFTWVPTDTDSTIKKLKQELSLTLKEKIELQDQLKAIQTETDALVEYFSIYKQYATIRSSTRPAIPEFWDKVDTELWVFTNPTDVLVATKGLSADIVNLDLISKYKSELATVSDNIRVIGSVASGDTVKLEAKLASINQAIGYKQLEKSEVMALLQEAKLMSRVYTSIESIQAALEASRSDLYNSNVSFTVGELLRVIDSNLSTYKVSLIESDKELQQYDSIKYTADKYKAQIEDLQENIKVLTIALDELSPKNGLIAKSVSSFLNVIIGSINSTIASIWDYKMVLKAIDVENDSLNYKFKVEVEDKLPIDDIKLCSRGMQEVINLSFKVILYKLLGLEGTPFYADELASALDGNHTSKMVSLIQQLSTSDKYSQVFIISHKENFTFLRNLETIELG